MTDLFSQRWGDLRTARGSTGSGAGIPVAGVALVEPGATRALDLLGELIGRDRLWVVSTAGAETGGGGRRVTLPCDRGTVPASLLGLIEVVVSVPDALTVIATSHAPAVADPSLRGELAIAFTEAVADRSRLTAIDDPASGALALLIGGAEAMLRSFARVVPRLTRLFAYSALMKGEEREQFLLRAFVGLPIADLSPGFARSGRVRHRCHGEAECDARSRSNRALAVST